MKLDHSHVTRFGMYGPQYYQGPTPSRPASAGLYNGQVFDQYQNSSTITPSAGNEFISLTKHDPHANYYSPYTLVNRNTTTGQIQSVTLQRGMNGSFNPVISVPVIPVTPIPIHTQQSVFFE
jgi:hypothetical protein